MNILIIEKDKNQINSFAAFFQKENIVDFATSYDEALTLIEQSTKDYDVIISDYTLNKECTINDVASFILRRKMGSSIPVIIIYSNEEFDALLKRTRASQYPKVNFVTKPNISHLGRMVKTIEHVLSLQIRVKPSSNNNTEVFF